MAQPVIQHSFNSGEWAPALYARTDLEKYRSGAALLRNFFVDYRGGASTRSGTRYIIRGYKDGTAIRLIPFQASITVGFVLEFGDEYIRFHRNGAPVLESGINITGVTQANPAVVSVANSYSVGDWVFIDGVGGMTELNGKYFIISARDASTITLDDLFGDPVDSTGFGMYTTGGTTQRVFTLTSPYDEADLALLKFTQNVSTLILTHPDYTPRQLIFTSATSWALTEITFGSSISAPSAPTVTQTNLGGGANWHHSYLVTAVDGDGQESAPSTATAITTTSDPRTTAGTLHISWSPVSGANSYNVYKAGISIGSPIPQGVPYGFIGNCTGTKLDDSNIGADFSISPPISRNPFDTGSVVANVNITTQGSYTTAPTVTFGAPAAGTTATGTPVLEVVSVTSIAAGGSGYTVGDQITLSNGVVLEVDTESAGAVTAVSIIDSGSAQTLPSNPVAQVSTDGSGTGATFNLAWGVESIIITDGGSGYTSAPTVTFSAGIAAGTAVLGPASAGNPTVPAFFQQRLTLMGQEDSPQTFHMSKPGLYFNFDVTNPIRDDDAITGTIVSGQLSNIKAAIAQPGGLIILTDGASFLINGGSLGAPVTPTAISSNPQSFLGCNDMPPIVVNFDILYVQSKGSSVRDSTYNFYANVFTGKDISLVSSHLFFGFELQEWSWEEEPYKLVWAVRNDGKLLSLTFIKEQEFEAWAQHDTDGSFKSVASIVETSSQGFQNFTYFAVERTINGNTVQYIEYFPERDLTGGVADAWTVDAALRYDGSPETNFSGGEHLVGETVTGLADGEVITPFVMDASGDFTLPSAASKVTIGKAFTPQIQSLYIDLGDPTVQSKEKKIPKVTLRVNETLGLRIGSDSSNLVAMKDLVVGNVGSMTNEVVTDLVTGDAGTILDPKWQEKGQVFIEQDKPFPASVLGIIPDVAVGDTAK